VSNVAIPLVFDIEFSPGVWTSMVGTEGYIDNQSGLSFQRGISLSNRVPEISTCSFNLDNASEVFTPGNTSSTFYNKLREGIGVRWRSNYSATTRYHFEGIITAIKPMFPLTGKAGLRVPVECEGLMSLLARHTTYSMGLQQGQRTGQVMAAIMTAAGSSSYSFETNGHVIPYAMPRDDALADLAAAAASEPFGGFWEDGQSRPRLKRNESMLGGFGSPTHTWGTTIVPDQGLEPDYRNGSRFARIVLSVSRLQPTSTEVELWREPTNVDTGSPVRMAAGEVARITGTFTRTPVSVRTKFQQTIASMTDTGTVLYAAVNASQTTVTVTKSTHTATYPFAVDDLVRVDDEFMGVTAVSASNASFTVLTVTRGANGSTAASHATPPTGTPVYRKTPLITLTDIGFVKAGQTISSTGTSISYVSQIYFNLLPKTNDIIRMDGERMKITSVNTSTQVITVTRQYPVGAGGVSHAANTRIYREDQSLSPVTDFLGPSHIRTSADVSGLPANSGDIVGEPAFTGGEHIRWLGRQFEAMVRNSAAALRYRSSLVIGGRALELEDNPADITYERAIPGILGIPEGPSVSMPYGITDSTSVFVGVDEVQTLTFAVATAGGFVRLAFRGAQTGAILWTSVNADLRDNVLAAIEALPTIVAGNVDVSVGTMTSGIGTLLITFVGALGQQPLDEITIQENKLAGGASAGNVSNVQTTQGVSASPSGESRVAKAYAMGLLRGGRVQTPWLTVKLLANQSDNVTSVLNADITDLVRYTGTGSGRESIDDWYRIMSVAGEIDTEDNWWFTFQLAPAHLNRNVRLCWWTNFASISTGRGEFAIAPVGVLPVWPVGTQWVVAAPPSSSAIGSPMRAYSTVAAPNPTCVNLGASDMVVWAHWERGVAAQNTFPVTTGGYGIIFRSGSVAGTTRWEVRANPTQSLIYLWNTSAGVVASAPWTPTDSLELEVRAMGNRIRVYRDCLGEPIIDVDNATYLNTATYAEVALNRTPVTPGQSPYCTEFGVQGI
jgi:hypothetical protein